MGARPLHTHLCLMQHCGSKAPGVVTCGLGTIEGESDLRYQPYQHYSPLPSAIVPPLRDRSSLQCGARLSHRCQRHRPITNLSSVEGGRVLQRAGTAEVEASVMTEFAESGGSSRFSAHLGASMLDQPASHWQMPALDGEEEGRPSVAVGGCSAGLWELHLPHTGR